MLNKIKKWFKEKKADEVQFCHWNQNDYILTVFTKDKEKAPSKKRGRPSKKGGLEYEDLETKKISTRTKKRPTARKAGRQRVQPVRSVKR